MSSSDSNSCSSSNTSDVSDEVYTCQFRPYEGEPLVCPGEDLMGQNQLNNDEEESDKYGLKPAILAARFDRKVKFDSW